MGQLRWLGLSLSLDVVFHLKLFHQTAVSGQHYRRKKAEAARFLEAWTLELAHMVFTIFYWPYLVPRSSRAKRNRLHLSMEGAAKNLWSPLHDTYVY